MQKQNPISVSTYLTMNSMTWLFLTRPAGCIRQSALRTLELDWLVFTGVKKPPPHHPLNSG